MGKRIKEYNKHQNKVCRMVLLEVDKVRRHHIVIIYSPHLFKKCQYFLKYD
jgi:hypothetical protein